MKESYGTLSQTISGLKEEGYTFDFNIRGEYIVCHEINTVLSPDDFKIDRVFRFEGESNPDDEAVLYAISSPKYNMKGLVVNGYGPSSEDVSAALVKKLKEYDRHSDK